MAGEQERNQRAGLSARCATSSLDGLEFVDGAEVVVVVLGHEETEIDDGHRLSQSRMQRSPRQLGRAHSGEPFHNAAAGGIEAGENVRDRAMEQFKLPTTGIAVGYPKAHIVRPNGDLRARGVTPDIAIHIPAIETPADEVLRRAIAIVREN